MEERVKAGKRVVLAAFILMAGFPLYAGGGRAVQDGAPAASNAQLVEGGELRFGFSSEPSTLDPLSPANTADGRSILFNVFEGLVKPDTSGGFQPAAAESYAIEQAGKVYAFTLRQGLLFHDGSAVTPADVKFSLETAIAAGFSGTNQIESVEIVPDRSIRITLKAPNVDFLFNLTAGIVPKTNADREKNPIGTGPFKIRGYTPQQSLVLVKNPDYWQRGLPHLDKITYVFVGDSSALLLGLQSGNLDAASVTGDIKEQIDPSKYQFVAERSNSTQLLALNNGVKPLDDLRVRQAINYAVDRQEIIDAAFAGGGEPWGSPVIPAFTKYTDPSLKNPFPPDIAKAKSLLTAAGLGNGFNLEITIPSNYAMHVRTGEVIVNQLAKIDVKASIRLVDWGTWLSDIYQGRKYEATIVSIDGSFVSPQAYLQRYRSDNRSNFVNYSSKGFDDLYNQVLAESNESKRISLYLRLQKNLVDEAASVYIQDIIGYKVFPKNFAGFVSYPLYVFDFAPIYQMR
jgi:peptide/nickel transport system substrate-binding protein